jgi:2-dehydropantoate 2-reductase
MRVRTEDDFSRTAWLKLLVNLTANPLTALTGRRAEVICEPKINALARSIMDEAQLVAQAEGVNLTASDVEAELQWLMQIPAGSTSSMRQDRLAGRPLEYDALTGAVLRAAERHGIEVPVNRMIFALLAAIEPQAHTTQHDHE